MLDAWLDLVLGSCCSVCGSGGRALCAPCDGRLPTSATLTWPSPTPPGLVPPWSTGEYAGALRSLVVDHKDHGRLSLADPLGRLLAVAVAGALGEAASAPSGPAWLHLVPVPSHPAVVRRRGQDPLLRITRRAGAVLRRRGVGAVVLPALRVVERPVDQAGLGAADRVTNVAGRFGVRPGVLERREPGPVLLVDDVVTTGSTLREAQRALEGAGVAVHAAAAVAATRRRGHGSRPRLPIPSPGG